LAAEIPREGALTRSLP